MMKTRNCLNRMPEIKEVIVEKSKKVNEDSKK